MWKAARNFSSHATQRTSFHLASLPNGLRIVSSDVKGHFSALGLYVNAGSRYESSRPELIGLTHMLDKLAFKSTANMDGRQVAERLELLGGNYQCSSSRESIMYQASVFNRDVPEMLSLMADTVRNPTFATEEIEEQKMTTKFEIDGINMKPDLALPELLHTTAYNQKTLGSPLLCPLERIPLINKDHLIKYRKLFYTPKNIVLAFVGVDHGKARDLAEKYFGDWQTTEDSPMIAEPAQYVGGEICIPSVPVFGTLPELVHMQIGFEGLPIDHPDIYALATLQTLLGGGGSFSAGGPGKGMYSRLYTHVLNQYFFVENCVAFNHSYSDSGIFGISLSCVPQAAPYMAEVIAQQLSNLFANEDLKLTDEEVSRAKTQLKSSLLMNLESKLVELEDMGRQVQLMGRKVPVKEMVSKIEALSPSDLKRVAEMVFTGKVVNKGKGTGKATIVMQGPREPFGDVKDILNQYGLGNNVSQPNEKTNKKNYWFQ